MPLAKLAPPSARASIGSMALNDTDEAIQKQFSLIRHKRRQDLVIGGIGFATQSPPYGPSFRLEIQFAGSPVVVIDAALDQPLRRGAVPDRASFAWPDAHCFSGVPLFNPGLDLKTYRGPVLQLTHVFTSERVSDHCGANQLEATP